MTIREVRPEDGLIWERLRYELWPGEDETHGEVIAAFFQGGVQEPEAVLLAEEDGRAVIAFAELSVRTDLPGLEGQRVGYVEGLYVVPEMRSRGVARALLAATRSWARGRSCTHGASDRDDRVILDRSFTTSR